MPTRRKVEPEILETAIKLFGTYGFHGVTTRDLAKAADVMEGSIYTWFKSKDLLYKKAVATVIEQVNLEFHRFVVTMLEKSNDSDLKKLQDALRTWYRSIPEPAARLLMQVIVSDNKLNKAVREPLTELTNLIADGLDRQRKAPRKSNSQAAARTLLRALVWAKVENDNATSAEHDMNETLQWWIPAVVQEPR